jgi:hypothetical protein
VNPPELFRLLTGAAKDAEDLSIQRHFVNPAGKCVRGVKELIGAWGDANRPGRAGMLAADGLFVRYRTHPWTGAGRHRHIQFHFSEVFPIRVKNLNPEIAAIGDIYIPLRVGRDAVRRVELSGFVAGLAD